MINLVKNGINGNISPRLNDLNNRKNISFSSLKDIFSKSSKNDEKACNENSSENRIKMLDKNFKTYEDEIFVDNKPVKLKFYKKSQYGSNPGMYAVDDKNNLYYTKQADEQTKIEVFSSKLYKLAGIEAADMSLYRDKNGEVGLLSKYVENEGALNSFSDKGSKKSVNKGFAVDAWLANWDAVISDNTLITKNGAVRIDFGGCLDFRAMGGRKNNFGNEVPELNTLIDPKVNWQAASIYETMSRESLIDSLSRVVSIKNEDIENLAKECDMEQYTDVLINRKNYLKNVFKKVIHTPQGDFEDIQTYMKKVTEQ